MRIGTIGLALGAVVAAATASYASTAIGDDPVDIQSTATGLYGAPNAVDEIVIARRDRGDVDSGGDDHRGNRDKDKGGKGRGSHDDGPNHDLNDDRGEHGPNHT